MAHGVELWSDFDGTAVEKLSKGKPAHWRRNFFKTDLAPIAGYAAFLNGVRSAGVEIAGVVSRRAEFRRRTTMASIGELGLEEVFTPDRVMLMGSEEAKGRFVAERSRAATVAVIEDQPQKLGPVILGALLEAAENDMIQHHPLVLGVVSHPNAVGRYNRFLGDAGLNKSLPLETSDFDFDGDGVMIATSNYELHVGVIYPYSYQAGHLFGSRLQEFAQ